MWNRQKVWVADNKRTSSLDLLVHVCKIFQYEMALNGKLVQPLTEKLNEFELF